MHRRLHERIAFFPVVLLSLLGAVACTPYATYPPMSDVEPLVPGLYPVPQVMGKSLKAAYDKTSGNLSEDGNAPALVYALPEGISQIGTRTNVLEKSTRKALREMLERLLKTY